MANISKVYSDTEWVTGYVQRIAKISTSTGTNTRKVTVIVTIDDVEYEIKERDLDWGCVGSVCRLDKRHVKQIN